MSIWDKPKIKCDKISTCGNGVVMYKVTVMYNKDDMDILYLCSKCADFVVKDAVKYNYTTKKERIVTD